MATFNFRNLEKCQITIIINPKENGGKGGKGGKGEKRKAKTKKPGNLPILCRFQEKCKKGPGECEYRHVEPHLLEGCKRSFMLFWGKPGTNPKCRFVHLEDEKEPAAKKRKEEK